MDMIWHDDMIPNFERMEMVGQFDDLLLDDIAKRGFQHFVIHDFAKGVFVIFDTGGYEVYAGVIVVPPRTEGVTVIVKHGERVGLSESEDVAECWTMLDDVDDAMFDDVDALKSTTVPNKI